MLDNLDDYVIDAKDNIIKADDFLRESKEEKNTISNRIKILLLLILFVIIGIIIALILILNK